MFPRKSIAALFLLLVVPGVSAAADKKGAAKPLVSEGDMTKTAAEVRKEGDEVAKEILGLLDAARKEKDILKVNCVNEKLTAAKELLQITGKAEIALQERLSQKESGAARVEYEKIDIAKGRLRALAVDARACVGVTYTGETKLEVEEPKNLPDVPLPGKSPTSPILPPGPTGATGAK